MKNLTKGEQTLLLICPKLALTKKKKRSDIEVKSEMGKKKEENKQVFIYVSHFYSFTNYLPPPSSRCFCLSV
jgi:hypothetical protein